MIQTELKKTIDDIVAIVAVDLDLVDPFVVAFHVLAAYMLVVGLLVVAFPFAFPFVDSCILEGLEGQLVVDRVSDHSNPMVQVVASSASLEGLVDCDNLVGHRMEEALGRTEIFQLEHFPFSSSLPVVPHPFLPASGHAFADIASAENDVVVASFVHGYAGPEAPLQDEDRP